MIQLKTTFNKKGTSFMTNTNNLHMMKHSERSHGHAKTLNHYSKY